MAPCEITDDYYEILEVSQTASVEIVKKSYRRLAVALHPDKNLNKPSATAAFQCVSCLRSSSTITIQDDQPAKFGSSQGPTKQ